MALPHQPRNEPEQPSWEARLAAADNAGMGRPTAVDQRGVAQPQYGSLGRPTRVIVNFFQLVRQRDRTGTETNWSSIVLQHYDIRITKVTTVGGNQVHREMGPTVNRRVFGAIANFWGPPNKDPPTLAAYDGRHNVYTPTILPEARLNRAFPISVQSGRLPYEPENFSFTLRHSATISLGDLEPLMNGQTGPELDLAYNALTALTCVLKHATAQTVPTTRKAYFPEWTEPSTLPGGLLLIKGFTSALRVANAGREKLLLNLDTTSATFFASPMTQDGIGNLVHLCGMLLDPRLGAQQAVSPPALHRLAALSDRDRNFLKKRLFKIALDIRRTANEGGITRNFKALSRRGADQESFVDDQGKRWTIAEYFAHRYTPPRFPRLPCVIYGNKNMVPIEFCSVRRLQKANFKLDRAQQQQAIQQQAAVPLNRLQEIVRARGELAEEANALAQYNLSISARPMEIDGRMLAHPVLTYRGSTMKADVQGAWNLIQRQVIQPPILMPDQQGRLAGGIRSWAILNLTGQQASRNVVEFATALHQKMNEMGIPLSSGPPIHHLNPPPTVPPMAARQNLQGAFDSVGREAKAKFGRGPAFILVIVPESGDPALYAAIKVAGDDLGQRNFTTQVMLAKHIRKVNPQYLGNLVVKLNLKCGGTNHQVREMPIMTDPSKTLMLVGADVSHSGSITFRKPSIASLVGSLDRYCARYTAVARAQALVEPREGAPEGTRPRSQEPIAELQAMMTDLLTTWSEENVRLRMPGRVIFYRDGVSDGELAHVFHIEVSAIRAALDAFQAEKCGDQPGRPKTEFTYVVCGKRHHVRFFPRNVREADKSGNVPAGLVVDRTITHTRRYDFYIQSQGSLKGTARPCHYTVLHDDSNHSVDDLQRLTNELAHNYQRATRAVSLAAPAYYADLFAARARLWVNIDDDASTTASEAQTPQERAQDLEAFERTIGQFSERLNGMRRMMWWT